MFRKLKSAVDNVITVEDSRCAVIELETDGKGTALFNVPEMSKVTIKGGDFLDDFVTVFDINFTDERGARIWTYARMVSSVYPDRDEEGVEKETYSILAEYMNMGMQLRLGWSGISAADAALVSEAMTNANVPTPPPGVMMLGSPNG